MPEPFVYLNSIVHANPCSENWDAMPGDEWTRHCDKCDQNVYNLSAMTAGEAEAVLQRHEGKVCTKLYRRPDGSVLTQRCPSSIRKRLLRIGKWAAAAGFAIPALAHEGLACSRGTIAIDRTRSEDDLSAMQGVVADATGAIIPGVKVTLQQGDRSHCVDLTARDGSFRFLGIEPSVYDLIAEAPGFSTFRKTSIAIAAHENLNATIKLEIGSVGGPGA